MNTRVCTACGQTEEETVDNNIFTDVKADRFEEAILWAFYNGITSGTGDGTTFSPENPCTRKQIVTFLWRAAGEPEPASMENPFTDVKADRFEKAILWAYCEGITSGTGDGTTFSPETPCTRKQIVTFLWRAAGEPEPASMENPFTDVKSDRFEKAILWAAEKGITTGTGDGSTFSPENSCTRKQIVTFLYREMQSKLPADPVDILEAIYALELGEALPYPVTLTGVVYNIDQQYTGSNEGAFLDMKVADKEYVSCLYLTGEDMIGIRAGDVISVTGTIRKYNGLIVFEEGCVGVKV